MRKWRERRKKGIGSGNKGWSGTVHKVTADTEQLTSQMISTETDVESPFESAENTAKHPRWHPFKLPSTTERSWCTRFWSVRHPSRVKLGCILTRVVLPSLAIALLLLLLSVLLGWSRGVWWRRWPGGSRNHTLRTHVINLRRSLWSRTWIRRWWRGGCGSQRMCTSAYEGCSSPDQIAQSCVFLSLRQKQSSTNDSTTCSIVVQVSSW